MTTAKGGLYVSHALSQIELFLFLLSTCSVLAPFKISVVSKQNIGTIVFVPLQNSTARGATGYK